MGITENSMAIKLMVIKCLVMYAEVHGSVDDVLATKDFFCVCVRSHAEENAWDGVALHVMNASLSAGVLGVWGSLGGSGGSRVASGGPSGSGAILQWTQRLYVLAICKNCLWRYYAPSPQTSERSWLHPWIGIRKKGPPFKPPRPHRSNLVPEW